MDALLAGFPLGPNRRGNLFQVNSPTPLGKPSEGARAAPRPAARAGPAGLLPKREQPPIRRGIGGCVRGAAEAVPPGASAHRHSFARRPSESTRPSG